MDALTRSPGRLIAIVGAVVVIGGLLVVASGIGHAAPGEGGYPVTIAHAITPALTSERVAAISRGYLDAQTPKIEGQHYPPVILAEWAVPARDARHREPAIPPSAVSGKPDRVVWIIRASGDFLNLTDRPWSIAGAPYPEGNIVIDDATGVILGVYPHAPPGFEKLEPTSS